MKFKVGDRVKFTNKVSWADDFTGSYGVIEDIYSTFIQPMLFVKFDNTVITDEAIKKYEESKNVKLSEEKISKLRSIRFHLYVHEDELEVVKGE